MAESDPARLAGGGTTEPDKKVVSGGWKTLDMPGGAHLLIPPTTLTDQVIKDQLGDGESGDYKPLQTTGQRRSQRARSFGR